MDIFFFPVEYCSKNKVSSFNVDDCACNIHSLSDTVKIFLSSGCIKMMDWVGVHSEAAKCSWRVFLTLPLLNKYDLNYQRIHDFVLGSVEQSIK